MAVKRGPDGRIIDEPTRGPGTSAPDTSSPGTDAPQPEDSGDSLRSRYERRTYMPGAGDPDPLAEPGPAPAADEPAANPLDPKTTIVGRETAGTAGPAATAAMEDPPVGWLVIVDGPGKGEVLTLGYGRNKVGRGDSARVRVNFGDGDISRESHCIIDYEPRAREFSIQHADGVNFTYVGGAALHERRALAAGDIVEIGSTAMRFVPFCSPDWDWKQDAAGTGS